MYYDQMIINNNIMYLLNSNVTVGVKHLTQVNVVIVGVMIMVFGATFNISVMSWWSVYW